MDDFAQSFYPVCVAADMVGYHPRTVEKLIRAGRVRWRRKAGRLYVQLESLLAHQQAAKARSRAPLRLWLRKMPRREQEALSLRQLAERASRDLGGSYSIWAISRARSALKKGYGRKNRP